MTPVQALVLALVGLGALAVLLTYARGRAARAGFLMSIELWTAAALLQLTGERDWLAIAVAATAVLLRKFLLPRRPTA